MTVMLDWSVMVQTDHGLAAESGTTPIPSQGGPLSVVCTLPEGVITEVSARFPLSMSDSEKIFMNGYQSWTYSPELDRRGKMRGLHGVPKFLMDVYHFDRYGDYNFVPYANKRGVTHGHSYCYLREGERFRLIGSLDERPGYTVFRYDSAKGLMTITRDCAGVRCEGDYHLFDLYFASGVEDEVFDGWFEAQGVPAPTAKPLRGYSSWYNRYEDINEASIVADLRGCEKLLKPGDLFQIDDGWERSVGDWIEDEAKFPQGLRAMTDQIHDAGFMAGLWLAPFVTKAHTAFTAAHDDWLIKVDGKPWDSGNNWGGFYPLDIDNPEVIAYIKETFHRVFDLWGFDLVKLDFLYAVAPFNNERESRAGRMIRAMELLRELCQDKLILGCGVPLMPAFGRVDYCRIGADVSLDWNDKWFMRKFHGERPSTKQSLSNTIFRRELDHRAFLNDPDVFFLRDHNIKLSKETKLDLARADALLGSVYLTSDEVEKYDEAKRKLFYAIDHLRDAEEVRVKEFGGGYQILYRLDGVQRCLPLPQALFRQES